MDMNILKKMFNNKKMMKILNNLILIIGIAIGTLKDIMKNVELIEKINIPNIKIELKKKLKLIVTTLLQSEISINRNSKI
jgi:hypothetical protein